MLRLSSVEPAVRPSRSPLPQLFLSPVSMGFTPGDGPFTGSFRLIARVGDLPCSYL